MAYISTEEVKEMRTELKKLFPAKEGWKLSISREHMSTINVVFVQSKEDLDPDNKGNYCVSEYYIKDYPENLRDIFNKTFNAINGVKQYEDRNSGDMGADYGDSNFFYNVYVGKWSKDFVKVA